MKKTFRHTFVAGLLIILPVLVSIWVVGLLFGIIDRSLTPLVLHVIRLVGLDGSSEVAWLNYLAPLVSISLAAIFISLVGLLGGNILGRQILKSVEQFVKHVPIVNGIYSAARQFIETFSSSTGSAFRRVVLVEFPQPGFWMIGFVTSQAHGEINEHTSETAVAVFVPTAPNPTGGWLIYVPEKKLASLKLSVDEAFKVVISCGVLSPADTLL